MKESQLVLPIWVDPDLPASPSDALPIQPDHVASWISSNSDGPSRHIALTSRNTIYIHSSLLSAQVPSPAPPPPPQAQLPTIKTPPNPSPVRRPIIDRTHSAPRRRAGSISSSIKTTSSHRRVSAFSPPPSAKIPSAVLTSATVTAVTHDAGTSTARGNLDDKSELRDHLREQRDRDINEERGLGLGIALGRRSIHVHSKDDIESSGSVSPPAQGNGVARSTASFDSGRAERTGGLRGWLRGEQDGKDEHERDMKQQLEEIEVERAMEKEREEERREAQERIAMQRVGGTTPRISGQAEGSTRPEDGVRLKRVVLDQFGRGRIVSMLVFEEIGVLAVLRDIGSDNAHFVRLGAADKQYTRSHLVGHAAGGRLDRA